ncbi:hypothetical protein ACQKM9_11265 [Viridibacillus sp. NPDC093762]|uniref:hypothetical protein n=1 Tax=Viridibacillus sp. NPDC093762 TaxID=3390720 RepID=UPI003D0557F1
MNTINNESKKPISEKVLREKIEAKNWKRMRVIIKEEGKEDSNKEMDTSEFIKLQTDSWHDDFKWSFGHEAISDNFSLVEEDDELIVLEGRYVIVAKVNPPADNSTIFKSRNPKIQIEKIQ